jgi:hypothetical protein
MKSVYKIIKEEYIHFLNETYDDDIDYSYFEREEELKLEILNDFLYKNNVNFTKHIPWSVVPFARLKKIWEDYMQYGFVRDTRGLEMIEGIMLENTSKINVLTNFAGHTQWGDSETLEENIGYWVDEQLNCVYNKPFDKHQLEIPFNNPRKKYQKPVDTSPCNTTIHPFVKQFIEDKYEEGLPERKVLREILYEAMTGLFFDNYMWDKESEMGGFISDYGLNPLVTLAGELRRQTKPEDKLVTIDKMLNVVHQRSDIANWFVEGGSRALSQLSGYASGEEDSAISGSYRMHDYN